MPKLSDDQKKQLKEFAETYPEKQLIDSPLQCDHDLVAELLATLDVVVVSLMRSYKMTSKLEMEDHKFGAELNELVMRLNEHVKAVAKKARGEK